MPGGGGEIHIAHRRGAEIRVVATHLQWHTPALKGSCACVHRTLELSLEDQVDMVGCNQLSIFGLSKFAIALHT